MNSPRLRKPVKKAFTTKERKKLFDEKVAEYNKKSNERMRRLRAKRKKPDVL